MIGTNFPVPDELKNQIIDAYTLSKGGGWWTAILLFKDPNTNVINAHLYRWKNKNDIWMKIKDFKLSRKNIEKLISALQEFADKID